MILKYDGEIAISTGKSRHSTNWKNSKVKLSELYKKLSTTHRTHETQASYFKMSKDEQAKIKDIGGFVSGIIASGKRNAANITSRSMLTLDADHLTENDDIWFDFTLKFNCSACLYTTHKHTSTNPRIRLMVPLDRGVSPEEYEAISRRIAGKLGINLFDDTTFQPNRLMYWPSTSKDGLFEYEYQDGPWLSVDEVLAEYIDWKDINEWTYSDRVNEEVHKHAKKQGDPLAKDGVIGAFCRTHSITEVIEEFLSDIYAPTAMKDRYTFIGGTTAAGLIIYEDRFAYSHHSTDPCSMKLCNAFDLVRIHKFGELDADAKEGNNGNKRPSHLAMLEFATKDSATKEELGSELFAQFEDLGEDQNNDWAKNLEFDKWGKLQPTRTNVIKILEQDPRLKSRLAYNSFSIREIVIDNLPWREVTTIDNAWRDSDDANLRCYLEGLYGINAPGNIKDALDHVVHQNAIHPIKEYLDSLKWDMVSRIDNLLIDYLGAENTDYVVAVTRKTLVAAVARIYEPGTKFDTMLVLIGAQGVGKSTLIAKLAMDWYASLSADLKGKEAMELLQGNWIIEMEELSSLKKAETETIKVFISKHIDTYRVAYGKRTGQFPRQCIFIGTTNTPTFLRDTTGGRRFWPVELDARRINKSIWNDDLSKEVISQIWAEAVSIYKSGKEKLHIDDTEIAKEALLQQQERMEENPLVGIIEEFLEKKITSDWYAKSLQDRCYLINETGPVEGMAVERTKICALEIWCECLGNNKNKIGGYDAKEINSVLDNLVGWKRAKSQLRFGSEYGRQRGYERVSMGVNRVC